MNTFSSLNRSTIINELKSTTYDLLIIGGGITGAGIALDASKRGLKVALVDMQDFAGGTSSKSTKLIHGGLRYLKQLDFKLVAEVGKEREIVHRNAPHLTKPEPMLLPIVKNGSLGKFSARIGMMVYEWLAGVKKEEWHKVLNVQETLAIEPLLNKDTLLGGILFYEYRTDDARLTLEVLKTAHQQGATAINYCKVNSFLYTNKKISGAVIQNQFTSELFNVNAKYVVNATGPWVDELDLFDETASNSKLHITKGVHLVINHKKLPVKQSVYFDTPDKRMMFIIPREGKTYIGTTDTFYTEDIDKPTITNQDRDYILNSVNQFFSNHKISISDIESGWAGLRPLINKPGKGPSEISRKDEVFEFQSGLLTISGGKLTGYRKMAQRITDIIAARFLKEHQLKIPNCETHFVYLSGGNIQNYKTFVANTISEDAKLNLTIGEVELLIQRFGSNTTVLFKYINEFSKTEAHEIPILLRAQLHYCIENEMCFTPSDFFIRRTGGLYFDIELVKKWHAPVCDYMKQIFNWNNELESKLKTELLNTIHEIALLKMS